MTVLIQQSGEDFLAISLEEFLAQIGQAGVHAAHQCSESATQRIQQYCDVDENGVLTPKMLQLVINDRVVEVPLLTLVPVGSLRMRDLTVELDSTLDLRALAGLSEDGKVPPVSLSLKRNLLGRTADVKVRAQFRLGDPLESVETLRDSMVMALKKMLEDPGIPATNKPDEGDSND